jgi:predicted dinucleotide-binding enzyme
MFVCGDDAAAKAQATTILKDWFGWREVLDLGGISSARTMEMYSLLWVNLMGALHTPHFNIKIVK